MSGHFLAWSSASLAAFLLAYFATIAMRKGIRENANGNTATPAPVQASKVNELVRIITAAIACAAIMGGFGGWLVHDSMEFHNTFVLTNAVVEGQNGVFVTYHFESDATKRPRTIKFCTDYIPEFQPGQVIEEMVYTRKAGCESIAGKRFSLTLRRVNGVPILKEQ